MKATLHVINKMQADGIIRKYAIGGAIGATFYLEPTTTFDIDIFVPFDEVPGKILVSLDHIFDYLKPLGYKTENEHVMIEGWQVQFLPADDPLYNEALMQAVEIPFQGEKTWVMTAEHLMAIALKTGRGKDLIRINQFLTSKTKVFDENKLNGILARHGLLGKWERVKFKFKEMPDE